MLAVLLALAALLPGRSGAQSVSDIVFSPVTGHWYEAIAVPAGITWSAARTAAEARSHQGFPGHLVTLTTAEEAVWVNSNLPLAFQGNFFIGGFQPTGSSEPFGGWRWVTEEPWHYIRWAAGRPTNNTFANVLALAGDGRWQDVSTTGTQAGYVVEYGNAAPPAPLITFSRPQDLPIFHPREITTGDFDQDGHLDLLVCASIDASILYGRGDGTFEAPTYLGLDTDATHAVGGDIDGDGDPDLVVTSGSSYYLLRRIGPRTYGLPERTQNAGTTYHYMLAHDLNDDGKSEIVMCTTNAMVPPAIVVLTLAGNNRLSAVSSVQSEGETRVIGGDWNRDGRFDLAATGGSLRIYLGQSGGSFATGTTLVLNTGVPQWLVDTDWDRDGRLDLMAANVFSGVVSFMKGTGSGGFSGGLTYPATPAPYNIDQADLDHDGDPDLVTSNGGGTLFSVFRNTGGVVGQQLDFTTTGSDARYTAVGDFNEDGRADVVVGHDPTNNLSVFLNTTEPPPFLEEMGLVSWWRGDGNTNDATGRNPGASVGVNYGNGVFGQSFMFDGVDDGINIRDAETLRLTKNLSITAWIHVLSLPAAGKERTLFFRGDDRPGRDPYRLSIRANGTLAFEINSRTETHSLSTPIQVGQWMHVAATLDDESDAVVLYVNGQQAAQNVTEVRPYRTLDYAYGPGVGLGNVNQIPNPAHNQPFHGRIDELRLYDQALTASEVAALVNPFPTAPAAPGNLTATAVSESEIDLNWQDKSTNEIGFEVWRTPTGGTFTLATTVATNVTMVRDSGLIPNTHYTYRVRAVNEFGESAFTNDALARTLVPTGPPAAPSGLQVAALSANELQVSWQDNSLNEETFELERKIGTGAFALIASPSPNVTAYRDMGLGTNTTYTYRVRARNSFGPSAYSSEASGATLPPPAPPVAPNNLLATALSTTELQISWQDNSTTEAAFELERKPAGGAFTLLATLEANVTSYRNAGLEPNTAYVYRVRARNVLGASTFSSEITGITLPLPPSAFAVSRISESRIDASWTNGNSSPAGHRLERALSSGGPFTEIAALLAGTSTHSDTGLDSDRTYFYRVRAVNPSGYSVYTSVQSARTLPVTPGRPTNLAAALLPNQSVRLTWNLAAGGNPQGIKVERSENSGGTFVQIGIATGAATSYDDASAQADRQYQYRVRAYNDGGHSLFTLPVNINTPPAAPSGLSLTPQGNGTILLQWQDNSTTETGFRVERRTGNGSFDLLAQLGANFQTYSDTAVAGNTAYTYRVRALGPGGLESAWSNEASTNAQPLTPTNVTAQPLSASQIQIGWTDANGTPVAHRVERSPDGATNFTLVGTAAAGVASLTDSGRSPNTRYYYRVRAEAGMATSSFSSTVSALTFPATPSALTVTPLSATTLRLAWTDNNATPAPHRVERSATGSEPFETLQLVPAGTTTWDHGGLAANTTYHYRVLAQNGSGVSTPAGPQPGLTLPLAPTGLTATGLSQTQVRLQWTDANPAPAQHKIERSSDGGSNYLQLAVVAAGTSQWEQDGLQPGTTYLYRVRAFNPSGNSSFAGPVSGGSLPPAPTAPTGLQAAFGSPTQVHLRWTDASTNETGFEVERRTPTGTFTQIAQLGTNVTTYVDTVSAGEAAFIYRVRAVNPGGASAYTSEAQAARPSGGKLVVTPKKINYGTIRHRRIVKKTVTVKNTGRGPLGVNVGLLNAPFRVTGGSGAFVLQPRKNQKVTLEFTPTTAGKVTATLIITSTDPAKPSVSVSQTANVR